MAKKMNKIEFKTYSEVLELLDKQNSHLLLGNGFNRGLGVNTRYEDIFEKMTENDYGVYKEVKDIVAQCDYDLEKFIGKLKGDINANNSFLKKYVANKVKYDFMKATYEIVKDKIKNIYAEKNEGVFLLLQKFTNYFTLNYDPLLYLLLLNFKLEDNDIERKAIAMQPSLKFIEKDMNEARNNIYSEIKKAREKGAVEISIEGKSNSTLKAMDKMTKKQFVSNIEVYSKDQNKGWKATDIEKVVKKILEEEKRNKVLSVVNDGSKQMVFEGMAESVFDVNLETQNLFFLHGAFHIYKDGKIEKKITQTSDKSLYDRLEEILNNEDRDIICVFQAENKIDEINKSKYLKSALAKLSTLTGSMVIIGSSLSGSDQHVFDNIKKSKIDTIYIASKKSNIAKDYNRASKMFRNKTVILFDRDTISYG